MRRSSDLGARDLMHQLRDAGFKLVAAEGKLRVTPASALTDDLRTALRSNKPELLVLLSDLGEVVHSDRPVVVTQRCSDCLNLLPRGTCGQPVAAGLLSEEEGFGIVWTTERKGESCPAFASNTPTSADLRAAPPGTLEGIAVIDSTAAPVACVAAYGYEVPDDGLMHGVPNRQ